MRLTATALISLCAGLLGASLFGSPASAQGNDKNLSDVKHFVIITQENRSFDSLFGLWEGVDGVANADPNRNPQIGMDGQPFNCLPMADRALRPRLSRGTCKGTDLIGRSYSSAYGNGPFNIDAVLPGRSKPCWNLLLRGCTSDLTHRFYQHLYQLNHGRMDRFVTGNLVSRGLAMAYHDTGRLPIYRYLHSKKHPRYVIMDRFFQAAHGGSFLNHMWMISGRTPKWPGAVNNGGRRDLHSVVDQNGMPESTRWPSSKSTKQSPVLYRSPLPDARQILEDRPLTAACRAPKSLPQPPAGLPCGNFVVNNIPSHSQPYNPASKRWERLPEQKAPTIGDRLHRKGVNWGWYADGWANAAGRRGTPGWTNGSKPAKGHPGGCRAARSLDAKGAHGRWPFCPQKGYPFTSNPFTYFKNYSLSTARGRQRSAKYLRDGVEFRQLVRRSHRKPCQLRPVSFLRFNLDWSEHPGDPPRAGNRRLTNLVRKIMNSRCRRDTMVIISYDENGGYWDHVVPPGQPGGAPGPSDWWGPSTRVPALVIYQGLPQRAGVDSTSYDTTSIAATLTRRYKLKKMWGRVSQVADLGNVFRARPLP